MENLEAFRRTLESIHRKNDASQTLNSVTVNLAKAKSELSNATKALADLMDIADEGNCKACLVFHGFWGFYLVCAALTATSVFNLIFS